MLLHEHALAARTHPVHGLWFSGGGMLEGPTGNRGLSRRDGGQTRVCAGLGRDGDVARGIARLAGSDVLAGTSVAAAIAAAGDASRLVFVLPRATDGSDVTAAVAAALHALDHGRLERVELVADGRGVAATWSMGRPSLWRRIAPRRARFVAPERTE